MPKENQQRALPAGAQIFEELDRIYQPEELDAEVEQLAEFHEKQPAEAAEP